MANQHWISVFQLKCTKSLQWNHCSWSLGYLYRCSPTPSSSSCTILFYFFLPFPRLRRFNCLPPPLLLPLCWYLVNKPLRVAGMLADNVRGWAPSFEGKCEILRTVSQPRTLSADIPASQKGVYLFYIPPINFHIAQKTARRKASVDLMANAHE